MGRNNHVAFKLHYSRYVVPAKYLPILLEIFSHMEELDEGDKIIKPLEKDNSIGYLSDRHYSVYKANFDLMDQKKE